MEIITNVLDNNISVTNYLNIFSKNNSYLDFNGQEIDFNNISNEEVILFDIETTGLNVKKTNLYLIGTLIFKDGVWQTIQFFANSIGDEKDLLLEFNELCKNYKYIVHFNGNHFDIPYLTEKFNKFQISSNLDKLFSLDIYTLVKDYKIPLGLTNCKQKTIESLLELVREDKFNGGELIPQYFSYAKSHDEELYHNLLLHNFEDLKGMLDLFGIINYIKLIDLFKSAEFEACLAYDFCTLNKVAFSVKFPGSIKLLNLLFKNVSVFKLKNYEITRSSKNLDELIFKTDLYTGRLFHFFEDFQNYYYIEELDMAIHKSLAKYYQNIKKQKAIKANCYISKIGTFVPLFNSIDSKECFKASYKELNSFILFIDEYGNNIIDEKSLIDAFSKSIKS